MSARMVKARCDLCQLRCDEYVEGGKMVKIYPTIHCKWKKADWKEYDKLAEILCEVLEEK